MSDNSPVDTAHPPQATTTTEQADQSPPPTTADVPKDKIAQDAGASAIPDTTDTKTEPEHTSTDLKSVSPKTGDDDAAPGQGDQVIDITSDDGVNTADAKGDPTATEEDKAKELEPEPSKLDASHPTQPDTSTSSAPTGQESSSSTQPPKDEIKALPTVLSPATSSDAASLPEVSPSMVEGSATPKPKPSTSTEPAVEATPAPSKTVEPGPTPAPAPVSQPGAPAKPPPGAPPEETQPTPARAEGLAAFQTPGASTRISPDLAEFDPFATPAPSKAPPKLPQRPQIRTDAVRSAPQPAPQAQGQPVAGPSRSQRPSRQNSRPGSGQRSAQGSAQGSRSGTPNPRRQNSEDNEPAFNFAGFLRDLKVKSAEPVARYLKR